MTGMNCIALIVKKTLCFILLQYLTGCNVHCTVYSVHYTLYNVHCTVYTIQCIIQCSNETNILPIKSSRLVTRCCNLLFKYLPKTRYSPGSIVCLLAHTYTPIYNHIHNHTYTYIYSRTHTYAHIHTHTRTNVIQYPGILHNRRVRLHNPPTQA